MQLPQPDRRASPRLHLHGSPPVLAAVAYGEVSLSAEVLNVSAGGVCLLVAGPVPVGSRVTVSLGGTGGGFTRALDLDVLHARPTLSGGHVIGGSFAAGGLSPGDLAALLTRPRGR
jgi:PilZ domain